MKAKTLILLIVTFVMLSSIGYGQPLSGPPGGVPGHGPEGPPMQPMGGGPYMHKILSASSTDGHARMVFVCRHLKMSKSPIHL